MDNDKPSTSTQENNSEKRNRPKKDYVYKTKVKESPPSVPYTSRYNYFKSKEGEEPLLVSKGTNDSESISIESNSNTPSSPNSLNPLLSIDLEDEHGYPGYVF